MPAFEMDFIASKGMPIEYKGMTICGVDRIPVNKKFSGTVKLVSTNSEWKQAVRLKILKGKLFIGSKDLGESKGFFLWEDYLGDDVHYFEGTTKDSQLLVHNAWEQFDHLGTAFTNFWKNGAAMIVEVDGNTRRYRCNDGHPDDNFDDIIFEITINEES